MSDETIPDAAVCDLWVPSGVIAISRLVLSPHLDDAVFSAFHALDARTVAATVCSGGPPVGGVPTNYDRLTRSADPAARYEERRAEDHAAAAAGGWRVLHLGVPDAPYRPDDPPVVQVAEELAAHVLDDTVSDLWVPAAIGGHRDHLLTRAAGFALAAFLDCEVRLYADLPYAATFGWPGWVRGTPEGRYLDIDSFWGRWLPVGVHVRSHATVYRLDPAEQAKKLAACRLYRTQFDVSDSGPSRLLSHPERIGVEVSWAVL